MQYIFNFKGDGGNGLIRYRGRKFTGLKLRSYRYSTIYGIATAYHGKCGKFPDEYTSVVKHAGWIRPILENKINPETTDVQMIPTQESSEEEQL